VAGQREPAPPSNFSKLGGFNNSVFITDGINPPQNSYRYTRHLYSTVFFRSSKANVFGCISLKNLG
jgi:hypothetical protein